MSKINLFFFVFLFIVNCSFSQEKKLVDGVFAVIGDQVIFYSDIENQIIQYTNQGLIQANDSTLKESVIEDLFLQKLLLTFFPLSPLLS